MANFSSPFVSFNVLKGITSKKSEAHSLNRTSRRASVKGSFNYYFIFIEAVLYIKLAKFKLGCMTQIKISPKFKHEIIQIILKHISGDDLEIFLFGSFAQNKSRLSSDVDLCLKAKNKIDYALLLKIKSELEESNIPFKIDLIDFHAVDDEFKKIALQEVEKWL